MFVRAAAMATCKLQREHRREIEGRSLRSGERRGPAGSAGRRPRPPAHVRRGCGRLARRYAGNAPEGPADLGVRLWLADMESVVGVRGAAPGTSARLPPWLLRLVADQSRNARTSGTGPGPRQGRFLPGCRIPDAR